MSGRVVGSFSGAAVPLVGASLAVATRGACAARAFGRGHVTWPADITHCARGYPEKFVFRAGLIPACVLIGYMFWMLEKYLMGESELVAAKMSAAVPHGYANTLVGTLGMIAAACLIVSSSVIEDDGTTPWALHSVCASSFFLLAVIAQIVATSKLLQLRLSYAAGVSSSSVFFKLTLNALCIAALLLDIVAAVYGWHAVS